jgi:hypothetical protein
MMNNGKWEMKKTFPYIISHFPTAATRFRPANWLFELLSGAPDSQTSDPTEFDLGLRLDVKAFRTQYTSKSNPALEYNQGIDP